MIYRRQVRVKILGQRNQPQTNSLGKDGRNWHFIFDFIQRFMNGHLLANWL